RDPQYSPNPTSRIALANHLKPRPEEEALCVALTAELKQQGFHLVPQEEADYTLTYWIEDNWYLREIPKRTYDPGVSPVSTPMQPLPPGAAAIYSDPFNRSYRVTETLVDDSVPVQGIRLQLYYRPSGRTGRPQTVWEGYIDAGFKVSPEREPALLKTLLTFFGKDYTGRARLVE
ncbi:MAG: hypothetical protein DME26_17655, partial [Verrucomicrobia bacterium]